MLVVSLLFEAFPVMFDLHGEYKGNLKLKFSLHRAGVCLARHAISESSKVYTRLHLVVVACCQQLNSTKLFLAWLGLNVIFCV